MDYLIIQYSAETIIAARFGVTGKELTFSGAAECALDHDNGPADIARQIGEAEDRWLTVQIELEALGPEPAAGA